MTVLNVLRYPETMLKRVCDPVREITEDHRSLIADMAETMVANHGIGLAASQVGLAYRIFIVDIWWPKGTIGKTLVFINPKILGFDGVSVEQEEGCLSLPGIRESVARAEKVRIRALDINGASFELEAEGLLARAIQHEFDHLNGILLLDRLSPALKRMVAIKVA